MVTEHVSHVCVHGGSFVLAVCGWDKCEVERWGRRATMTRGLLVACGPCIAEELGLLQQQLIKSLRWQRPLSSNENRF